jgi:glutamine amidotransferase
LIAILDYGSGNLRSAQRAFESAHSEVIVTSDPDICINADGLVVPGVGAFGACMEQFKNSGAVEILDQRAAAELPTLGICVGMQIFFAEGREKNAHKGLGIWPGAISAIDAPVLPHIGWNTVSVGEGSQLFAGVEDERFYFVHSFAATQEVEGAVNTFTTYGSTFISAVETPYFVATQFHPEKSGDAGLRLISNWISGWVTA